MGVIWASKGLVGPGTGDVVHTRQVIAGTGLSGGGDLSADRTLAIAAGGVGTAQVAAAAVTSAKLDPTTIQYATVTLTSAQIKALHTTPVTLVAAQGSGTLIEILNMVQEQVFGTVQYSAAGVIRYYYANTSGTRMSAGLGSPLENIIAAAASAVGINVGLVIFTGSPGPATMVNQDLVIAASGAFTSGDGTLIIKIGYRVHSGL